MPETHAVGPAPAAQRRIWGQVRRLNLTTGVTHGGAGAESGGDSKGGVLLPFFCGLCVTLTGKAAGIVLRYKRFALRALKGAFCGICDESHHEFVGSDALSVPRVDPIKVSASLFVYLCLCLTRGPGSRQHLDASHTARSGKGAELQAPRRVSGSVRVLGWMQSVRSVAGLRRSATNYWTQSKTSKNHRKLLFPPSFWKSSTGKFGQKRHIYEDSLNL